MKRAFKNFIYYLANTDPQVVKHFAPQDRFIPDLIGMSVLLAALVSTCSVGYFLMSVFGGSTKQYIIVPIGCILYFFIIVMLDKGLFLAQSSKALMIRGAIVMCLVSVTSVPFKLALQDSKIETVMNNMHKQKQAQAYTGVAKLKADYRTQQQVLNNQLHELQSEKNRMERMRDAENSGLKLNGRSTGVEGKGKRWKQYNNQVKILQSRIQALKKTINKHQLDNTHQTTVAEEQFKIIKPEQDQSFISRYIAFKQVLSTSDEQERIAIKEFNVGMYMLFVLIELSPVFLKLLLGRANHIAIQTAQDSAFEKEGLRLRKAYMVEALRLAAPSAIDPNQITEGDIEDSIRQTNQVLKNNRDSYKSISGQY
ncbi:DUF4407 domain-containing protein [Microscilla marina]|uniref:DUF4407 domain-containing protein n=1 Tax=Microscilla marina ATCC 23134 TaxID=313606 RepID=A1ZK14_MICM2|nr:DUF4407 domain-containing protein [Microscilla marina]EAY29467.1 hypothetical protein M23134_01527 [Microscilla marina ATCC 23134]